MIETEKNGSEYFDMDDVSLPSLQETDKSFNQILAGGAKTKLLESFVAIGLTELLFRCERLSCRKIAEELDLHPLRTQKWLHLLGLIGLLEEIEGEEEGRKALLYGLSPLGYGLVDEKGKVFAYSSDKVNFWQAVAEIDFIPVLRGKPLPLAVRWPPRTFDSAYHLEWWMSATAEGAIKAIEKSLNLKDYKNMLDAAGGAGTMACHFASQYPDLVITMFNLPNSAYLARENIVANGLVERVFVEERNFITDESLPTGFDIVLWSRVLCDWPSEAVVSLLEKTRRALLPGGEIVICEPLVEGNEDLIIAWEFRYIFSDDFGVACYKTREEYEFLLRESGFEMCSFTPPDEDSFYSVIRARRL
jgi:SAM-dependent methyltransferase